MFASEAYEGCYEYETFRWSLVIIPGLCTFLCAPGSIWLVFSGATTTTWQLRMAALFATVNWLCQMIVWQTQMLFLCDRLGPVLGADNPEHRPYIFSVIMTWLAILVITAVPIIGILLATKRMQVLEKACQHNFFSRQLGMMFPVLTVLVGMCAVSFVFFRFISTSFCPLVVSVVSLALLAALVTLTILAYGLLKAVKLAKVACDHAPEDRLQQARKIHTALKLELACVFCMLVTCGGVIYMRLGAILQTDCIHLGLHHGTWEARLVSSLMSFVDGICNELYALSLSGALSGAVRGTALRAAATKKRQARWQKAHDQWQREQQSPVQEQCLWDEKVKELAGRGLSLEALLGFYRNLPTLMPSFDATQHTTNDVVRNAIIPYSAKARSACASVLMDGQVTIPDKMVTHNWSNLFRDLVAAIVADGLGESEFSMIAQLLMSDQDRLDKWVADAKVGGRTYWVCAFAVNQHAGICNSVRPGAKDTVTKIEFSKCECGLPKAGNDTEPLLPDGRGIPCEMNKFDDMMKFLSATSQSFEQVCAIDAKFSLFSRAWCVAELATASGSGMMQRLKIFSQKALSEHSEAMRSLRIQDMQASRPEDKQAILNGIEDLDAFNVSVQKLLFEDLFPAWTSLDAAERLANAGTVIRWLPVWAGEAAVEEPCQAVAQI